ncbi:hypothetical protein P3T76_001950 [Phytophthora citrophthora]|uniref:Uncharacterized protein n=1 Tax=Phytophthora citrophthora TaxID=4793 RepID=A0AAD9GX59_9STRA|nr:hypothetical protein P3T76_001950 [Phytophthora citrophthora]
MSDVKASPAPSQVLPGSERADYRGKCLYKTGKCVNERALKTSGTAHNLCDEHRNRQNQHQRKLDAKNRLHKRERRVSARSSKGERFVPYSTDKRQSVDSSDEAESADNNSVSLPSSSAATPSPAPATAVDAEGSPTTTQTPVLATANSGVMFLPNGPQPPQVTYPFVMQDFDGIVVPLPSYLEGQERIEFRSRIYQKVLDFISEECILRFGAKVEPVVAADAAEAADSTTQTSIDGLETEQAPNNDANAPTSSEEHIESDILDTSQPGTEEARTKKVH